MNCLENNQVTSKCQMDFLDKTCKKDLKQKRKNITIEFYIFRGLGTKFQLKLTIKKEWNENHHRFLHIGISLGCEFYLQQTILIFWNKFVIKRILSFKNRKSQHHHSILYIWIRLNTKLQLKLTISVFWTKVAQKGYLLSTTDAMNTTIELCIFELV